MSARDDFPEPYALSVFRYGSASQAAREQWADMCDEIDRLRSFVARVEAHPDWPKARA